MQLIIAIVTLVIIIVPISFLSFKYLKWKRWHKRVLKYSEEYGEKLKREGIAKIYDQMSNENFFFELKKLEAEALNNKDDVNIFVECGCKAKIMEDILNERNVAIPRSDSEL